MCKTQIGMSMFTGFYKMQAQHEISVTNTFYSYSVSSYLSCISELKYISSKLHRVTLLIAIHFILTYCMHSIIFYGMTYLTLDTNSTYSYLIHLYLYLLSHVYLLHIVLHPALFLFHTLYTAFNA